MRSYVVGLGLLFIALCHPSFAQKAEESVVRVVEGEPLTLECPLRVEQRAEWRREGGPPPPELRPAGEAPRAARLAARLAAPAARAAHAGVYTCSAGPAAHRVRLIVLPAAEASAVAAATTAAALGADSDSEPVPIVEYDINRLSAFALNCSPSNNADVNAISYTWQKNGTSVELVPELKDRYKLEQGDAVFQLTARGHEDDYGNYSCRASGAEARAWRVHARPLLRLLPNTNVVEGQKLKLTCKVIGKPYPAVRWTYAPAEGDNASDVAEALGGRARLAASAAGAAGAELALEAAARADAGVYTCWAPGAAPAHTVLRVKDMYAALWPFLGICLEVFVLCAIILVYEKRRTKPELDDSDTDNHDQKES